MLKHAVIPFLVGAGLLASAPFATAATNLVFCSEGSPAGFDPGQYTTGTDFDASAETMFNRLTQFERGGTAVIPGLATKWDISEDGLTYTFHLREGVKFHTTPYFKPTREFNADDVLFTFNRMINKDDPFRKAYPTEFPYFTDMGMDTNITKIDKVDDHTVKFTLNEALEAPVRDVNRIVLPPASFLHEKEKIEDRWPAAVKFIQEHQLNEFIDGDIEHLGIITLGGLTNNVQRALQLLELGDLWGETRVPMYVLNVAYPLVEEEVLRFCQGKKAVLVVEEGQPDYHEQHLNTILRRHGVDTAIHG